MPTSTRFAVAVHAAAALAFNHGGPVRSEDIARSASTNPAVIRKLFCLLADAGITDARLGLGGGAVLARPPENVTLLDVYRAVEEPVLIPLHRRSPDPGRPVGRNIQAVFRPVADRAQQAMEAELAKVTLADVARNLRERVGPAAIAARKSETFV